MTILQMIIEQLNRVFSWSIDTESTEIELQAILTESKTVAEIVAEQVDAKLSAMNTQIADLTSQIAKIDELKTSIEKLTAENKELSSQVINLKGEKTVLTEKVSGFEVANKFAQQLEKLDSPTNDSKH